MIRDTRMARLDPLVQRMYADYQTGMTLAQVGEKYDRDLTSVATLFRNRGLKCRSQHTPAIHARIAATRRAKLDALATAMYADYQVPMSLGAVGRKYGRSREDVRGLFQARGLAIRPPTTKLARRLPNGQVAPAHRHSMADITALIEQSTKLVVPSELKLEWRKWPLLLRGKFISTLRSRLALPDDRPELPFSDNVVPFDYSTPGAHAIAAASNVGRNSRAAWAKIKIGSQGVIWEGVLWFWSHKVGYQSGPFTKGHGRPVLHHAIWERHNGRALPAGHVVRFLDGNPNNFSPANLGLATRNDICRENQAAALQRKSRATTALLLARAQTNTRHANTDTLLHLRSR